MTLWLPLESATSIAKSLVTLMETEPCSVFESVGRVTSTPVVAQMDLPRFCNSGMDGVAVLHGQMPLLAGETISVHGEHLAGAPREVHSASSTAVATGAELPPSVYAVIPIEDLDDVVRDPDGKIIQAKLRTAPREGAHIRRVGDDLQRGTQVLPAGHRIRAEDRMVLLGSGISTIAVRKRPRVSIIATGNELRRQGEPFDSPHRIENVTSSYLEHLVLAIGGTLLASRQCSDEPSVFHETLQSELDAGADLVITTGAVSAGRSDFVPQVIERSGGIVQFHRIKVRPGMPTLAATTKEGVPLVGLPGNPMSTAVGFRLIVQPMIEALLGTAPELRFTASIDSEISKVEGWTSVIKSEVRMDERGQLKARVLAGQESFRIAPLLSTNAWLVLDESHIKLVPGTPVSAFPLVPYSLPFRNQGGPQ